MNNQLRFGEDANLVALRMAWDRALNVLSSLVNKPVFESCVKTVVPLEYSDGHVVLGAATQFAQYWIEHKYLPSIQDILESHLGQKVKISVRVRNEDSETPAVDPVEAALADAKPKKAVSEPRLVVNEHFTLDNFVVGPSNRMAHAAVCAVAKSPGASYNPLFIYGGSGLGKTHLLHAIANFVKVYHPHIGFMMTNAEAFTCDYVAAVSDRRTAQFRKKYRQVDLLLVDDIQFLAGKERTREEFFHTFNALYEVGRQVVLTSDKKPQELQLDDRLVSRFEAGLVVDIAPPELETRMAIIRSKAEKQDLAIPNDVVLYIARLIRSNIRAIEGALMRLHAYVSVMNVPVSTDLATDILARYYDTPKENIITPETVQILVAKHFGLSVDDLNSNSREASVVMARQVAMYLIRQLTNSSLPTIGRLFGGKDHSTVLHAVKKISNLVVKDSKLADDITALTQELKGEG